MSRVYDKPTVKTLTVDEIMEILGPVSCGSGAPLSIRGDDVSFTHGPYGGKRDLN